MGASDANFGGRILRHGQFFNGLEGLRGVAALMVALFHIGQAPYVDQLGRERMLIDRELGWTAHFFRILGNGPGAVILFFILSGFVLTMVLQNGPRDEAANAREFLIGRIFRIYPAVISSLGIYWLLFFFTGLSLFATSAQTVSNYLLNGLLIQPAINGVTWSLQLEMLAAPLILLIYMGWCRIGRNAWLAPYILLLGMSFSSVWNHLIGAPFNLGQIYAFIAGMVAFLYGKPIVDRLPYHGWALALAIAGFALARPIIGWGSHWTILVESIFGSAIVAVLAFGLTQANGRLVRLMRFFGRISFSFYLLHPLTLVLLPGLAVPVASVVGAGVPASVVAVLLWVASIIAVTPLAWSQYHLIERPFIAIGKAAIVPLRSFQATASRS